MPKQIFSDNFTTELEAKGKVPVFRVEDKEREGFVVLDLRHLSNKMLRGERIDATERATAGAALSHLIALARSST